MSLDVHLECACCGTTVYDRNITHNLGAMAEEAGLYTALWRPEEANCNLAKDLIPRLQTGIEKMQSNKAEMIKLNPENGWGNYEGLLDFAEHYLEACEKYPDCKVYVSR